MSYIDDVVEVFGVGGHGPDRPIEFCETLDAFDARDRTDLLHFVRSAANAQRGWTLSIEISEVREKGGLIGCDAADEVRTWVTAPALPPEVDVNVLDLETAFRR